MFDRTPNEIKYTFIHQNQMISVVDKWGLYFGTQLRWMDSQEPSRASQNVSSKYYEIQQIK